MASRYGIDKPWFFFFSRSAVGTSFIPYMPPVGCGGSPIPGSQLCRPAAHEATDAVVSPR